MPKADDDDNWLMPDVCRADREGDTEPGYWGDGDPKVHKVSIHKM